MNTTSFLVKSINDNYYIVIQTVYDDYDFIIKLIFNRFFKFRNR